MLDLLLVSIVPFILGSHRWYSLGLWLTSLWRRLGQVNLHRSKQICKTGTALFDPASNVAVATLHAWVGLVHLALSLTKLCVENAQSTLVNPTNFSFDVANT